MASFFTELKRRNVFKVGVAYAIVAWIVMQVADTAAPALHLPDWTVTFITLFLLLGFPIAIFLAWAFELTPEGIKPSHAVESTDSIAHVTGRKLDFIIIGVLVLAVVFLVVDNYVIVDEPEKTTVETVAEIAPVVEEVPAPTEEEPQREVLPNSVAVLLCDNLSPDPDDAYFAASIHEEILNQLVKIRALNVIARTSVLQYADEPPPIPQIAEELNVGTVMECSVRFAGNAILVTAQLIDPKTNSHLWSNTYPGDLSDLNTVFAMQADIAMNIANALEAEFSTEEQDNIERISTDSPEAYKYYLRALAAPNPASNILLDQAIKADPEFALAYATRAVWAHFGLIGVGGTSPDEVLELARKVQSDAERAVTLDPTLGVAHAALAVPHFVNWRGVEAEQAFQLAIALSPSNIDVLVLYGRFKRFRGQYDEAIRLNRRAVELDPNNINSLNQLAQTYRMSGNQEVAAAFYKNMLDRGTAGISIYVGFATVEAILGNHPEAVRLLQIAEQLRPDAFRLSQITHVYALAGQSDDALRLFTSFEQAANEKPVGDAVWIRAFIAVGDYEQALQRLESAVQSRTSIDFLALAMVETNPWRDPELEKPAFRNLLDGLWND
jgi:TolB-like protein/Tfp pilus assembly protein PilF